MKRLLSLLLLAAALLGTGCKPRLTPVQEGDRTQTLLLDNGSEPEQIDPQLVTFQTDANIDFALFEGLTGLDPQTLAPEPAVAASWDVSPDGLVYTFHLRPEARWSDGSPVTAGDFLYSYRRILSPRLGSEYAYMHFMVKNAEAFNSGKLADFSQVGYTAPDDHTLRITLDHPVPYFLSLVAHQSWYPVQRGNVEKFGAIDDRATRWVMPGNLVGNGPFILKTWRVNDVIEVVKNPYYWDAASVRLNGIKFFPIESGDTAERAFRSGQLHVSGIPVQKLPMYRSHYSQYLFIAPELSTFFLKCNVTQPPLNNPAVRRALSMAIDREALIKTVLKGDQIPAYQLTPPDIGGYSAPDEFRADPDEARRQLAAAGYPNGAGFPKVELIMAGSGAGSPLAEAIQQMWKKTLNIDVSILNVETKAYYEAMETLHYQLTFSGWVGDYLDPTTFLDLLTSGNTNNQTGWADPAYDKLLDQAAHTLDPAARRAVLLQAEALAMNEVPYIPIFHSVRRTLRRPDIQGWYENVLDLHPYKYIWLDPAAAGPARLPRP